MKNQILIFLCILFSSYGIAQVRYVEGYIINNNNQRTDLLIKDSDWKDNPKSITVKASEHAESKIKTLRDIQEFGIGDDLKYIRRTVRINRSPDENIAKMDESPEPVFTEEKLFLKVLIEGKASLYEYSDERLRRYFFSKDGSEIEPLIYKRYVAKQLKVGTNRSFSQQLLNELDCGFSPARYTKIEYKKSDLVRYFREYNKCVGEDFVDHGKTRTPFVFHLSIRPGLNISSVNLKSKGYPAEKKIKMDNEMNFRIGLEGELLLPFNKHKWAFFVEPSYQSFKASTTQENHPVFSGGEVNVQVKNNALEVPIGVRHYFYLNDTSKLYLNIGGILNRTLSSSGIELRDVDGNLYENKPIRVNSKPIIFMGAGYTLMDKFTVELRYVPAKDIADSFSNWIADYKTFSFILGYTLF